jgi:hypothetical protein
MLSAEFSRWSALAHSSEVPITSVAGVVHGIR